MIAQRLGQQANFNKKLNYAYVSQKAVKILKRSETINNPHKFILKSD
jgi:hypothetical protein